MKPGPVDTVGSERDVLTGHIVHPPHPNVNIVMTHCAVHADGKISLPLYHSCQVSLKCTLFYMEQLII